MIDKPIALVTGAAQGIGYACAEAINESGVRLVLADINEDGVQSAAKRLGNGALAMTCDLGAPEQILEMFGRIEKDVGPVSILVNNAGIAKPGDFLETTLEQFQSVIDVNLIGTFVALQRAAKSMVANSIEGCHRQHVVDQCAGVDSVDRGLLRLQGRSYAADQGSRIGIGATQYPRERGRTGIDRH